MALGILLHGFGPRYDLPISLVLYLYGAGGAVLLSFVLIVVVSDQVGARAVEYRKWPLPFLIPAARSRLPRMIGGLVGVLSLVAIVLTGFFGSSDPTRNPAEYLTWIYFWAATVIASGVVGNLWYLLNPWAAIWDVVDRMVPSKPVWRLPAVGVWPAVAAFFAFVCFELTSGVANQPWVVATLALVYTAVTLAGMSVFGRDEWLEHCEAFTVLFDIVGRFAPLEVDRDESGRATMVYFRLWGVGLLKPRPSGWDQVTFVILMLSSLAFDGIIATPAWQDFAVETKPIWLPLGQFGSFAVRTAGLLMITVSFLLIFVAFMQAVIYFGTRKVDVKATISAFALTLVPIALAYNAAHNYSYVMVQSQVLIPLLNDPFGKGWHLLPALANYQPSFALAHASTIWYAQVVLIVVGHVIAVYLSHLRAGERFRTAQRALLSQYPMLLLMVMYTMTSLWILAQPTTNAA